MFDLRFACVASGRSALCGLLVAFGLMNGCADRTGVLVQVTRDEATTPQEIKKLRFFVGVEVAPGEGLAGDFVDDLDPSEEVALDASRDLLTDPYRLLLNRGSTGADKLMIAVAGYKDGELVGFGGLDTSVAFQEGKVLQWEVILRGNSGERVHVTDTGCLTWSTEAGQIVIVSPTDDDCDNDPNESDCGANDPTVGHGLPEICYNEIDDDCDELTDEQEDADDDGVGNCEDCDDTDKLRFPGNPEVCDGIDNDCNEVCDDGELDFDGDDYTICNRKILPDGTCSDVSEALFDCDDHDALTHPGAEDICDGKDNNCNGNCDEGHDPDGDKYTDCGSRTDICDGTSADLIDCVPNNEHAFPGNEPELCDGVDNDCDGVYYPATVPCYVITNVLGEDQCVIGERQCHDNSGDGWVGACMPGADATETVPLELCVAYDECADAADPWACANEAVPMHATCQIPYLSGAPGEVCLPAWSSLANTTNALSCFWSILPAGAVPHYVVGFTSDAVTGPVQAEISQCQPHFVVSSSLDAPPLPASFLLYEEGDEDWSRVFRVDLVPVAVATCPPESALDCTNLPPAAN